MRPRKADSSVYQNLVKNYLSKSVSDLRAIKPKWAYGENLDKLLDVSQHPKLSKYSIYLVETEILVRKTEFYGFDINSLFTGDLASDSRVASILNRWENEQFVDPPTISICDEFENRLSVDDGRHRTKVTYLLNIPKIPVAIHNSLIDKVSALITLTSASR